MQIIIMNVSINFKRYLNFIPSWQMAVIISVAYHKFPWLSNLWRIFLLLLKLAPFHFFFFLLYLLLFLVSQFINYFATVTHHTCYLTKISIIAVFETIEVREVLRCWDTCFMKFLFTMRATHQTFQALIFYFTIFPTAKSKLILIH